MSVAGSSISEPGVLTPVGTGGLATGAVTAPKLAAASVGNAATILGQVPQIVSNPATSTGLTGANTNFINLIPPAVAGTYRINWAIDTTTATTDNFTVVVTWKDSTGTARSQNSGGFDKAGTSLVAGAITNTIGAGNYCGSVTFGIDNSATAITLSTAGTFTTVTYNLSAFLEQLA